MASEATLDRLCAEFDSPPELIAAAVAHLERHATPAFLARYRARELGNTSEDRLHAIAERLHALHELEQRKATILQQAEERGRRTPELEQMLRDTVDQDVVDDFYQSMRPRRRGIAMQMEEKGLLPLALAIQHRQIGRTTGEDGVERDATLQEIAAAYQNAELGLATPEAVLEGALLILADRIAHDPRTRSRFRDELRRGILRARPRDASGAAPNNDRFKDFFDFAEPIGRIPATRMLALRRAEREGVLALELTLAEGRHRELLRELHAEDLDPESPLGQFYALVFDHAAQQLQEICGKDVRRRLKEKADREAVRTFARNLRSQLLAPPLGAKKVLALRGSSKAVWAALLNEDGSVAHHRTLPLDSDEQKQGATALLAEWLRSEAPAAIALPHGRRQAATEKIVAAVREAMGETPLPMVVPVDEAAATIFATSPTGKKALPGVEVGVRAAISLGRRLQDPLQELARMEARTLGIGQSLDDVHQGTLQRELDHVKSSCLSLIGCDLNTADAEQLALLPGVSTEQAQAIVAYRKQKGGFASREALRDVPGLDEASCRNIAGFLRIVGGSEPLDATPIHPDDYELVRAIAAHRGVEPLSLFGQNLRDVRADDFVTAERSHQHVLNVLQQLQRGREDGRGELVATANEGVHTLADLHTDRELRGRVAGLTEFGAFVDVGVGQDGLVHISQIPGFRLRDPQQMLRVGEVITVWVLKVDQPNGKISLSMLKPRHLQEGRLPTLGERLEQQQGRGRRPQRGDRGERGDRDARPAGAPGRVPGAAAGRPGRRGPGGPGEGGGEGRRFGRGGPRGPGDRDDRGDRDYRDDRGPRRGGPREQRVYTVEPAREVAETRSAKGEVTSLAGLRALLSRNPGPTSQPDAPAGGS